MSYIRSLPSYGVFFFAHVPAASDPIALASLYCDLIGGPMHTTFCKLPATRVSKTRVASRFSPTVQFVVVCIATHARQVCKGLQAASNLRAYRVRIAANARRRRV
uniref:SFRICE_037924 n=1 Tax=Spodoptera frugiperda TaxID=7108 RepID=A0A2H1WJU6_SPOFR